MTDKPKPKDTSPLEELSQFSGPDCIEQIVAHQHGVSIDRVKRETVDGETFVTIDGVNVGKIDWLSEPEDLMARKFEKPDDCDDEETKH